MKGRIFLMSLAMAALPAFAQQNDKEPADPKPAPIEAWQGVNKLDFGWGSTDIRYQRNAVPKLEKSVSLYAWKGERVNAQAVLMAPKAIGNLTVKVSDLKSGKNTIPASAV